MRNQFRRSNEFDKNKESKVASAKNPVAKERGFISFNDSTTRSDGHPSNPVRDAQTNFSRRSRRFDQVLDDGDFNDDGMGSGDLEFIDDICAPIQCDENDDGPDFTRMAKNKGSETATQQKKQDIRKRFMIERPKGAPTNPSGNLMMQSPGSVNSGKTVSTDMSLNNNPLAESLTAE